MITHSAVPRLAMKKYVKDDNVLYCDIDLVSLLSTITTMTPCSTVIRTVSPVSRTNTPSLFNVQKPICELIDSRSGVALGKVSRMLEETVGGVLSSSAGKGI